MNLILFEANELAAPLPRTDPRASHLLTVLRRREGDTFDAGMVNGPRGKGTLVAIGGGEVRLEFAWGKPPAPLPPISLCVGMSRPQTARDILRDATSLGVSEIHFVTTARSERSYAQSPLWHAGEWRRHLLVGAAQAFCTQLPRVSFDRTLAAVLENVPSTARRLALDNYEAGESLAATSALEKADASTEVAVAIGPERGWAMEDRAALRAAGFALVHLGERVLRTETACIAALTMIRGKLGLM